MNKLLLVEDKLLNSGTYEIEYTKDLKLKFEGVVNLYNYDKVNNALELSLNDKAILNFDKVNIVNRDTSLIINVYNNCRVNLNWIIINSGKNKVNLTINMLGSESCAKARVRVINKNSYDNINLICDGNILENTKDNELLEDLKGLIIKEDSIKISPNMKVLTNEVIANHIVTIGSFNKDELFYLESKGLNEIKAKELIKTSFITSIIIDNFKDLIKMEVISDE